MRRPWTDADYVVISGPSEAPKPRVSALQAIRLAYLGVLAAAALVTALASLAGGDIDTRDAVAADAASRPQAVDFAP